MKKDKFIKTLKNGVLILLGVGFAASFIKNSTWTKDSKFVKGLSNTWKKIKDTVYEPYAFKKFEMKTSEFDTITKSLKEVGCTYIIIGHSERRQLFGETDEAINTKAKAILAAGLTPIICCGETLEQREMGVTDAHIASQIVKALDGIAPGDVVKCVIAYEPIWAIGTGKTATSNDANNSINPQYIKLYLTDQFDNPLTDVLNYSNLSEAEYSILLKNLV